MNGETVDKDDCDVLAALDMNRNEKLEVSCRMRNGYDDN